MSVIRLLTISVLVLSISVLAGCIRGLKPIRVVAGLKTGETKNIRLSSGSVVRLTLVGIEEVRDSLRNAVREALVTVSVNGHETVLKTGNYNLPVKSGKVQIDCPWIKSFEPEGSPSVYPGDAMFRIWPEQTPYLNPLTFSYPVKKQKWFATMTQSGHEPVYVDWGEDPARKSIYYHKGHDIGGAEGMDEIISATDGLVISSGNKLLEGYESYPVYVHPDAVSILDDRGWIIEYVHLDTIFAEVRLGSRINIDQPIGLMGKKGSSGGWVHLHFEIKSNDNPTGNWITEDAYSYLWEAYMKQNSPEVVAVARPHQFIWSGEEAVLDGSRSGGSGSIVEYKWTFYDGTTAYGPVQRKLYSEPGEYSEILKVTDSKGNTGYDFAVIQVSDRKNPEKYFPTIQPAYYETTGIKAGEPVMFLVRTFNASVGEEVWNFGDGSPEKKVVSAPVDRKNSTAGRFAETTHSFPRPGNYIVTVERTNEFGYKATARLHVIVQ